MKEEEEEENTCNKMCAFRAHPSQRLFSSSPFPVKQSISSCSTSLLSSTPFNQINDDCSPDTSDRMNGTTFTRIKFNSHSSEHNSLDTNESSTVDSLIHVSNDVATNKLSTVKENESFTISPVVEQVTSQKVSSTDSSTVPIFKPIDIKCFLEPVYYTLPFIGMREKNKQQTVESIPLSGENKTNTVDCNNNNDNCHNNYEENKCNQNINTSGSKKSHLLGDKNDEIKVTMKSAATGSLVKRLSAAGITVDNDHAIAIEKISSSTQSRAFVNSAYNKDDDDDEEEDDTGCGAVDSTYDTYGPRFSRITLLDTSFTPGKNATITSDYSMTAEKDNDDDDIDDAGVSIATAPGKHGDLKSKPRFTMNLQRLFIKQSPCPLDNECIERNECKSNTIATSTSQSNHLSPRITVTCPVKMNKYHDTSNNIENAEEKEQQQQDKITKHTTACTCINEDIEGEKKESKSYEKRESPSSISIQSVIYSHLNEEMNGEGFKRWSRGKIARAHDAAYNPALSSLTGSKSKFTNFTETVPSLKDGQIYSLSGKISSLKFSNNKRSPLSSTSTILSLHQVNHDERNNYQVIDTAGIKGLSYIRKASLSKNNSNNIGGNNTRKRIIDNNGRRGSVMTTIFGQVGDRRFSQDLRSPSDFTHNNSGNNFDDIKGETAKVIFFQVFIPFLVAGFGNVGAGLILDHVQFWPVFRASKELFILVASFLGFKGNLEMTLAARLATQANCGQLDTLLAQIQVGIGNVALIQAQATVVAFLAAIIAISISYFKDFTFQFDSSLLIMTTSLVTAAITGLFLSLLMILVTIFSRKIGINPDNVSTLLAAFLGDISAVILLAGSAKLFYDYRYITWLQPAVCIAFFIILPVFIIIARKNKYTHDVVGTGWFPIIIAMIISSIAGLIFDLAVENYETIALLQPIINGVGANLVAVQASRISTYFHQRSSLGIMPADDDGKVYRICQSPIDAFIGKSKLIQQHSSI